MDEGLAVMEQAVLDCLSANVYSLPSAELISRLDRVHAFSQQVAALELGLVREVDARGLPAAEGAHSTGSWLAHKWRVDPGITARLVKLAKLVDSTAPQSGVALGQGRVNVEQVRVIASAVRELPVEHQPEGERFLLEQAAVFAPRDLGRLGERLLHVVDPEGAEKKAADQLAKDEARSYRDRTLSVFDIAGTSKVRISGWLDREGGAIIRAALDPLCAPRCDRDDVRFNSRVGAGAGADSDAAADAGAGTGSDTDAGAGTDSDAGAGAALRFAGAGFAAGGGLGASTGERDSRSPGQRRIDALVDICRLALATGELPDNGGDRPQLVVTVPFEVLRSQAGAATLDDGATLTAGSARRLACDAAILPAVMGGDSQLLDLGRRRRLFTGPVRQALVLRDKGCAFPPCDRPARWTDGHHIQHWADGGPTELANGVLLCGYHHRLIHQGEWTVKINPGDGRPDFYPPADLDPQQRPRRNTYHRRQ